MATLMQTLQLQGNLTTESTLVGTLSVRQSLNGLLTIPEGVRVPTYEGTYEVTPTEETQILDTNNLKMTDNVTINPIPSNYGLITWNGTTLTVS